MRILKSPGVHEQPIRCDHPLWNAGEETSTTVKREKPCVCLAYSQYFVYLLLLSTPVSAQDKRSIEDDYENPKSDFRFVISPDA